MYYKMSKNKKIVISFDSSGEMTVLWDIRRNEIVRTSDAMIYNWFRGKSGFTTLNAETFGFNKMVDLHLLE